KLLLLEHAFDTLGCLTVGWRTDVFNFASQKAIERLGAKRDGILRGVALRRDGTVRDTVMYSLIACEWPQTRQHLLYSLSINTTHYITSRMTPASAAPRFAVTDRYVATDDLNLAVNAALTLERPLLVKGEPGTGKTMLAEEV